MLQGGERIRIYGRGQGAVKAFCGNCGSSLFAGDWSDGEQVSIRMGAFDDDLGFVLNPTLPSTTAPWDEIPDNLPQYPDRLPL